MRYMILVKSTPAFEAEGATPGGFQPDPTVFAEMAAFHEELAHAGWRRRNRSGRNRPGRVVEFARFRTS